MAGSSPIRPRSFQWASPSRSISEILNEDRNSEARHRLLIEAAKKEHDRVREDAQRVYREHIQKEEQQRLLEEKRREEERIQRDQELAAERIRVNALRAKKIEIPPPLPEPEPPKPPAPATVKPTTTETKSSTETTKETTPKQEKAVNGTTVSSITNISGAEVKATTGENVTKAFASLKPPSAAEQTTPTGPGQPTGVSSTPKPATAPPRPPAPPTIDRYTVIHRNLKDLRKSMAQQLKVNQSLKGRMGDMRREIRKCVGQLSGPATMNSKQQTTIVALLREALQNRVQSQLINAGDFVLESRDPVQGAQHNEAQLPSLFIYLLNIFSKAVITQFIDESSARPETADPVGVCIASTFSEPDFLWRGQSLIDILMAKFRIACPVLFGYRGRETTEQGRKRIGWKNTGGAWIPEQQHMDRMTGLGAGFAAVALRNFSKAKKTNPYPPSNYWTAMAKIVNTPTAEISSTQCVVLRSMIYNYEQKFIQFYGSAALAALRTCLLEFPARVPEENRTAAINALGVLAAMLKKEVGLVL